MTKPSRSIMWFRRDLRLADLPALLAATADGREVVPLFVVDPAFAAAGAPRRAYLHDSLAALDRSIRDRSESRLLIRRGDPTEIVPRLAADLGADEVYVSKDFAPYGRARDEEVSAALRDGGRHLIGVASPYAVAPGGVRKGDGTPYRVFTPFSKVWRQTGIDAPHPEPGDDARWVPAASLDDLAEPIFERPDFETPPVGEEAGHRRWTEFLDAAGAADGTLRSGVEAYHDLRDLPALAGTSRLSADLKWGALHPRTLLADLDLSGSKDDGAVVFASELAWRDFYADVLREHPRSAWWNLDTKFDAMPVDTDAAAKARFDRWAEGTTGFGIVDAGMRQLLATGWMHNRVRMIVASFLVKDLHLPWQWGARWFLQHLIDGDLASNNHGWQWAAGTGTDAAPYFRVFNPTTQQERYDPTGEYVDRWAPDRGEPMLDHRAEREEALRRLATLKASG